MATWKVARFTAGYQGGTRTDRSKRQPEELGIITCVVGIEHKQSGVGSLARFAQPQLATTKTWNPLDNPPVLSQPSPVSAWPSLLLYYPTPTRSPLHPLHYLRITPCGLLPFFTSSSNARDTIDQSRPTASFITISFIDPETVESTPACSACLPIPAKRDRVQNQALGRPPPPPPPLQQRRLVFRSIFSNRQDELQPLRVRITIVSPNTESLLAIRNPSANQHDLQPVQPAGYECVPPFSCSCSCSCLQPCPSFLLPTVAIRVDRVWNSADTHEPTVIAADGLYKRDVFRMLLPPAHSYKPRSPCGLDANV